MGRYNRVMTTGNELDRAPDRAPDRADRRARSVGVIASLLVAALALAGCSTSSDELIATAGGAQPAPSATSSEPSAADIDEQRDPSLSAQVELDPIVAGRVPAGRRRDDLSRWYLDVANHLAGHLTIGHQPHAALRLG